MPPCFTVVFSWSFALALSRCCDVWSARSFCRALSWKGHWWENRIRTERGTLTWLCTYLAIFTDLFSTGYKTRWYSVNSWICFFSFSVFWKPSRWIKMKVTSHVITWSWRQRRIVRRGHRVDPEPFIKKNSSNMHTQFFIKMQDITHPFIFVILKCCKIMAILQIGCVHPFN